MKTKIPCPYCGGLCEVEFNLEEMHTRKVVVCDAYDAGCDKMFVADISLNVNIECRKVEGE